MQVDDNHKILGWLDGHDDAINNLIELSDSTIASVSRDLSIKIWDINNYSLIHSIDKAHEHNILSICQLKNGLIATYSIDAVVKLWDFNKNYKCVNTIKIDKFEEGCRDIIQLRNEWIIVSGVSKEGQYSLKILDKKYNIINDVPLDCQKMIIKIILLKDGKIAVSTKCKILYLFKPDESINSLVLVDKKENAGCLIQLKNEKIVMENIKNKCIDIYN